MTVSWSRQQRILIWSSKLFIRSTILCRWLQPTDRKKIKKPSVWCLCQWSKRHWTIQHQSLKS